jgi:hypothetical protein
MRAVSLTTERRRGRRRRERKGERERGGEREFGKCKVICFQESRNQVSKDQWTLPSESLSFSLFLSIPIVGASVHVSVLFD